MQACFYLNPGPISTPDELEPPPEWRYHPQSSFFSKMQTYQDAINSLLNESVTLLLELLAQTQNFIEEK
jgi:hypothetical protein